MMEDFFGIYGHFGLFEACTCVSFVLATRYVSVSCFRSKHVDRCLCVLCMRRVW